MLRKVLLFAPLPELAACHRSPTIVTLRLIGLLVAAALCGTITRAQPALEELERTLPPAAAEAPAAPADRSAPHEAAYLGLIADDTEGVAGVRVLEPVAGSPAAGADFRKGDLVVAAGQQPITDLDDLAEVIDAAGPGDKLQFEVVRGDERFRLTATLSRRAAPLEPVEPDNSAAPRPPVAIAPEPHDGPQPAPHAVHRRLLGVRAVPVDESIRQKNGLADLRGALVGEIFPDSPAAKADLPIHCVILTLDGAAIVDPTDLARRVAAAGPGEQIELGYYVNGKLHQQRVTLAGEKPIVAPAVPDVVAKPPSDASQLDAIERRLDELEQRLQRIEALLERAIGTPDKVPSAADTPANDPSAN
jgi:S1-C subfamily serine protease